MNLLPQPGTGSLQNSSTSQQNHLLGYITSAETSTEKAVTRATHADQARAWGRWNKWCTEVRLKCDIYLDSFNSDQKIRLLGAFAMALTREDFCQKLMKPWLRAQSKIPSHRWHSDLF